MDDEGWKKESQTQCILLTVFFWLLLPDFLAASLALRSRLV